MGTPNAILVWLYSWAHFEHSLGAARHVGAERSRGPLHGRVDGGPCSANRAEDVGFRDFHIGEVDLADLGADPACLDSY